MNEIYPKWRRSSHVPVLFYLPLILSGLTLLVPGSPAASSENGGDPNPFLEDAEFSYDSTLRWISVDGDEDQFRANTWMEEGLGARIDSFRYERSLGDNQEFELNARVALPDEDVSIDWRYEKFRLGYLQGGFEQHRKYFDDTGGYYAPFSPSSYDLDRDLSLEQGKVWFEAGLTRLDFAEMSLRYEYRYKEGDKATLQWGTVSESGQQRNIFPAFKTIDEDHHSIEYTIGKEGLDFAWENNAELEISSIETSRRNAERVRSGKPGIDKGTRVDESHDHIEGRNTLTAQKQINDWLRVSGGYLYHRLDSEASYEINTFLTPNAAMPPTTSLTGGDPFWFANEIILDRESHVINANSSIEPLQGLTFSSGLQSDWIQQEGIGDVRLDQADPTGAIAPRPATVDSDLDKLRLQEDFDVRYTKIPYTTLFVNTRFEQERIGQREAQQGGRAFLRDTDHKSDLKRYQGGFSVSPWAWTSLHVSYKRSLKQNDYDHETDQAPIGRPGVGYSAFIRGRDIDTDELDVKASFRVTSGLRAHVRFQTVATDFTTETDSVANGAISPGGRLLSGNYDANIYSFGVTLTPWQRLSLTMDASYQRSRTVTDDNESQAIAPYVGDIYSLHNSAHWIIDPKTDLNLSYTLSLTDYQQDNATSGLPLGMAFNQHTIRAGVKRKLRPNLTTRLQYAYYLYNETSTGGANDFKAHGIFASLGMTF